MKMTQAKSSYWTYIAFRRELKLLINTVDFQPIYMLTYHSSS